MARIAIASRDPMLLTTLTQLVKASGNEVVAAGTSHRQCIRDARDITVDLVIFDVDKASSGEIEFLLGAQVFDEFQTILITHPPQVLPPGFSNGVQLSEVETEIVAMIKTVLKPPKVEHRKPRKRPFP